MDLLCRTAHFVSLPVTWAHGRLVPFEAFKFLLSMAALPTTALRRTNLILY